MGLNDSDARHVPAPDAAEAVRLIAFYLPQYHPIPENDTSWGRGFTEWTNVAAAQPLFPGHYQPRLPAELGFYDLRLPEVRQAQADLAREHGIHGFCYYHYWFYGRRLLHRPLDEVLASGRPDFPFCLCWANEPWTRSWDGLSQNVLVPQRYDDDDDHEHGRWLAGVFRDSRYLRVDGKPLFLVYRPGELPDPARTAATWREEAAAAGIGEIFLCGVESLRHDRIAPSTIGFDANVEFQPDWLGLPPPTTNIGDRTEVYDYGQVVEWMLEKPRPEYRQFRGVTTGWDNTARRLRAATILDGSTPDLYRGWLEGVLRGTGTRRLGENLVFINAWNEWGEGAHLEPCLKWGRRYLEATLAATQTAREATRRPTARRHCAVSVSVCIPSFNGARYIREAIASVLEQSFGDFELLVIDDASSDGTPEVVESVRDERMRFMKNASRLGMVGNWNLCLNLSRGRYVTVFHQDNLMAPNNLEAKLQLFKEHPTIGFVHSSVAQIDATGRLLSEWWYYPPRPEDEGRHDGRTYFRRLLTGVNIVCAPSVVMRRGVFQRLGGFDPRLPFTADWEMWLRTALFFDVGYLGWPLVRYRRHEGMETERFSWGRQLEQSYSAKMLALERYPDRVPDGEELRRQISREYRDRAVAQARKELHDRRFVQASECLAMALGAAARLRPGQAADADGEALDEVSRVLIEYFGLESRREREVREGTAHHQWSEMRERELAQALGERDRVIEAMVRTRAWQTAQYWWSIKRSAARLLKRD